MRLEGTPERTDRVRLPDAGGQGTPPERGDKSEGSLAMSLCFTVLGSRDSKKLFQVSISPCYFTRLFNNNMHLFMPHVFTTVVL